MRVHNYFRIYFLTRIVQIVEKVQKIIEIARGENNKIPNRMQALGHTIANMCQFHQHFTRFLHQYFCDKKLQSQNVTREKLRKSLSHKKFGSNMLMKLTQAITLYTFFFAFKKCPNFNQAELELTSITRVYCCLPLTGNALI